MKQLVLSIPDNRYEVFFEFFRTLGLVKSEKKEIKLTARQKEYVADLKHALNEVEQHQHGKIKLQSAREFINEL